MANDVDLAYTAGIIDGEGSIQIARGGKCNQYNYFLRTQVSMNDYNVINWLYFTFGGSIYKIKDNRLTRKTNWRWEIRSNRCANFLCVILPYLKVKYEQATLAIAFQRHKERSSLLCRDDKTWWDIAALNQMRLLNLNGRGRGILVAPPSF